MNTSKAFELNKTVVFNDTWKDEKFSFTAKETCITPKVLQAFKNVNEKPIELPEVLSDILTDWSLDMDGKPFPPTKDNLAILPTAFLWQIVSKITEGWAGNEPPQAS